MTNLYPIKFDPILKERVWGGDRLTKCFNKNYQGDSLLGESWEISAVEGDYSIVSNGFLKGNDITDIIETYLGDIVGDKIYEGYGIEFPVLIKFLDINQNLSLQVHPDDEIAMERHNSFGKTECWYIMDAEPTAKIYLGFNKDITAQEFYDRCHNETIEDVLNVIQPHKGDFIFIKPGTIHSATGGVLVAEIQQVSDITYRVYDWGREHNPQTARAMHLDLAIDCINYSKLNLDEAVLKKEDSSVKKNRVLIDCEYFKVSLLTGFKKEMKDSQDYDSFIIYVCCEGEIRITSTNGYESIKSGETILIPAYLGEYTIDNIGIMEPKVLEVIGKA